MELIKFLIEHGADVNDGNSENDLPLHQACDQNDLEFVKYLIEHGADVNGENYSGQTALSKAIIKGNYPIVLLLLENGAYVTDDDIAAAEDGKNQDIINILSLTVPVPIEEEERKEIQETKPENEECK